MNPIVLKQLATQSCSVDNIRILRGEVMRLEGIRAMIWANIRETERAKGEIFGPALTNHVLFALQMIKAACDVTVAVAGEFVPGAVVVSSVYSAVSPNAENIGKNIAGQSVSGADYAKGVTSGLNEVIKQRLGGDSPFTETSDLTRIKTDLVINATALDEKAVLANLIELGVTLGAWSAKAAGKETLGKLIKTADEVRKAGLAYNEAYKDWKANDPDATFDAAIAMFHRQMNPITNQIIAIEGLITACGAEMPKFRSSAIDMLTNGRPSGPAFRAVR